MTSEELFEAVLKEGVTSLVRRRGADHESLSYLVTAWKMWKQDSKNPFYTRELVRAITEARAWTPEVPS